MNFRKNIEIKKNLDVTNDADIEQALLDLSSTMKNGDVVTIQNSANIACGTAWINKPNGSSSFTAIYLSLYGTQYKKFAYNGTSWTVTKLATETDLLSFIKTKTINILFNSVTWTKSSGGKYYCSLNFSSYITETINKIISVELSDFDSFRETDNIQIFTVDNTRFYIMSNTNSFASVNTDVYIRINYI